MNSLIVYICCTGLLLPLLILTINKGYTSANRYLAGFLFFSSLYLLENVIIFYSPSVSMVAFFTTTHPFFYLIGPFSYFYLRSILKDDSKLSSLDLLHFGLFIASITGSIPYLLTSWDYKIEVALNLQSDSWDLAQFHINKIFPHKVDQALNVLQIFYYTFSHWSMLWKYKRDKSHGLMNAPQYKLIRNWLIIFCAIFSLIAINFCFAMAFVWMYDDKAEFLNRSSRILLAASTIYVAINMLLLALPQIMYGLPTDSKIVLQDELLLSNEELSDPETLIMENSTLNKISELREINSSLQLFSIQYVEKIEASLINILDKESYLLPDFNLTTISNSTGIPAHHLTYYFNTIRMVTFSDWRNSLRIEYAKKIIDEGFKDPLTMLNLANKAGFSSQNTFNRSFRNWTGTTPIEYIKKIS